MYRQGVSEERLPKHLRPEDIERYRAYARRAPLSSTSQRIIILSILGAVTFALSSFAMPL